MKPADVVQFKPILLHFGIGQFKLIFNEYE